MKVRTALSLVLVLFSAGAGAVESQRLEKVPLAAADGSIVVEEPGPLDQKIDPALRLSVRRLQPVRATKSRTAARSLLGELPAVIEETADGACCVAPLIVRAIDIEGAKAAIEEAGGTYSTVAGRRIVARIPVDQIERLASAPSVEFLAASHWHHLLLDKSRPEMKADQVQLGTGLGQAYTGKGVVVGVVDSGIDWTHADFKDASGKSRIQFLWDRSGTGSPPAGYTTGHEYTAAQIDGGQCTEVDKNGHGTHVTGTAAGNGNLRSGQYKGIAPEADIFFVKGQFGDKGSFSTADEIEGCDYIFKKADAMGKRAVINMSLGGQSGPHDGTTDEELSLDALTSAGHIIVVSAGNDGSHRIHVGYSVTGTDYNSGTSTFLLPTGSATSPDVFVSDPGVKFGLICYPIVNGTTIDRQNPIGRTGDLALGQKYSQVFPAQGTKVSTLAIDATYVLPSGQREIYVVLQDAGTQTGKYVFEFYTFGIGRLDGWVASGGDWLSLGGSGFVAGDFDMTVGTPATAKKLLSVGAYVTRTSWPDSLGGTQTPSSWCGTAGDIALNQLGCFSSHGPTRDGRPKPDIAAPGMFILAPLSKDATEDPTSIAQGGGYLSDQGTSMSSPHVAGLTALMLQASPTLTPDSVKQTLQQTARKDSATTQTPNPNLWGAGKVDALAAVKAVAPATQPDFTISTSPTSLSVTAGGGASSQITTAVSGGFSSGISLSASGLPAGATASFSPATISSPGSGTSTMSISTSSSTPADTYDVTVTGSGGGKSHAATIFLAVRVSSTAPAANFSFSPPSPLAGLSVQFTDTSTGSPSSWSWIFGDAGVSTSQNPTHTFAIAGSYPVSLTVSNSGGSSTTTKTVTVSSVGPSSCVEDAGTMCLTSGRYQIRSHWKNQYAGGAVSTLSKAKLTDVTGAFWIANSSTYEYLIRFNTATDNGRVWIAIPTFTDVEFWIDVTDTRTGQSNEYHSPAGNRTLLYDTNTFVYP